MKTNIQTRKIVTMLRKANLPIWKRVAEELEKPTKRTSAVNLEKITKVVRDGETALVLGKVLSIGEINKKMTISAFSFSEPAKQKILAAGGEACTIEQLFTKNPKANKVRLLK